MPAYTAESIGRHAIAGEPTGVSLQGFANCLGSFATLPIDKQTLLDADALAAGAV
jgi:hypothetical protein